jgi:hypothetical protein
MEENWGPHYDTYVHVLTKHKLTRITQTKCTTSLGPKFSTQQMRGSHRTPLALKVTTDAIFKTSLCRTQCPSCSITPLHPQDSPRQKRAAGDGDMVAWPSPELCGPRREVMGAWGKG